MTRIDPRTVMVAIPCHDGKVMAELCGMLVSSRDFFSAISLPAECSNVSLVRNMIADSFLRSPFEWLVCIDSDIVPRREDFEFLLQPTAAKDDLEEWTPSTRIGQDESSPQGFDVLVCAEYPYKNDDLAPIKLGMGFVRIHRCVFQTLQELKHEDTGEPRLWQCHHQGRLITDFFPTGPLLSQFVPTAEWKGEDHGFFTLCMLAGLVPRIETRTRLVHIGRKAYVYQGPDTGGGQ